MDWTVWGSNPARASFSAPFQVIPGVLPASYKMGTGSFLALKRPERGVNHPLVSSTEVIARAQLHIYFLSMPSWPVLGRNLPFNLNKQHNFETYCISPWILSLQPLQRQTLRQSVVVLYMRVIWLLCRRFSGRRKYQSPGWNGVIAPAP